MTGKKCFKNVRKTKGKRDVGRARCWEDKQTLIGNITGQ